MRTVAFGKYRGWTYSDVCARHPEYVSWVASQKRGTAHAFNAFHAYCTHVKARTFLYVLPLVGPRYYVGTTSFPVHRLWQHRAGKGSRWTRLHRPVAGFTRLQTIPFDVAPGVFEDMWVKELMLRHGVRAVRGGTYTAVHLDDAQAKVIREELDHALRQRAGVPHCDEQTTPPPACRQLPVRAVSSCQRRLLFASY